MEILKTIFDEPKIIALVGDTDSGKSNCLYWMLESLRKMGDFSLYHFGLRAEVDIGQKIFTVEELEAITDSLVIVDEVMSMWDLENRKRRQQIEACLRLIKHNNNILLLGALPENLKKFISAKIESWIFKKSTLKDFINGSSASDLVKSFAGEEKGSVLLNIPVDKALVYQKHWTRIDVEYLPAYDTKAHKKPVIDFK